MPASGIPTPVPVHVTGPLAHGPADLVGSVLAERYRILRKLGEGGMGSVYLAEHTTINKRLAIKVLASEYSHKQDLVDRFLQEARAASMIEQENVVEITDFGSTPQGSVFFAMEYLNGEDLAATIKREGALPWTRVRSIMLQICTALAAAHAAGIIHRDMKPENCYRIRRGINDDFIKVLDFGIAKVQSDEGDSGRALTRTGMIFGTPEYMSPEQAKGERVDHRVDIYAAGVILYELLTGRVPFTADTFMGILTKHMFEAPAAPSAVAPGANIPLEAEAIILKALQKDREYRFQNMAEMAQAIEAVGTGAAPVAVVAEEVVTPRTGQLRFVGSSTSISMSPSSTHPDDLVPRSRTGLYVGLGIAAALLVGGVAAAAKFMGGPTPGKPEPTAAAATAAPIAPPPVADPQPDEPVIAIADPPPTTVSITIETPGVEAEVVSDADGGLLGKTNAAIEIPRGSDGLSLMLRAPGYTDLHVTVVPDAPKSIRAKLEAAATEAAVTSSGKGKGKSGKGKHGEHKTDGGKTDAGKTDAGKAEPVKTDPPKVDPPKHDPPKVDDGKKPPSSSPDLKDPFHNKKPG